MNVDTRIPIAVAGLVAGTILGGAVGYALGDDSAELGRLRASLRRPPVAEITPQPTGAPTPAPEASPSATEPSNVLLPDGRHPATIEAVMGGPGSLSLQVDVVQWLTGDTAVTAAIADGVIEPGEQVPNDYYVVNDNPLLRTLPVASDATVTLTGLEDISPVDVEQAVFAELFGKPKSARADGYWAIDGSSYFWLSVEGGRVTAIEHQWVP